MRPGPTTLCLFLSLVVGCASPVHTQGQAILPDDTVPVMHVGQVFKVAGKDFIVKTPIRLPDVGSNEPSIAVDRDDVVVFAPASGSASVLGTVAKGGYAWASHDRGDSYKLVLDPRGKPAVCSCDTDVIARDGVFYGTTMYWSVTPVFNANLVSSTDGGETWKLISPAVASLQPIDRPWLALAGDKLYFFYGYITVSASGDPLGESVLVQTSADAGKTWTPPIMVAGEGGSNLFSAKPVAVGSSVLIPLAKYRFGAPDPTVEVSVARVLPSGAVEHEILAKFPSSGSLFEHGIGAAGNGVVAAWAQPDNESTNIVTRSSMDGGSTWGPPRVLHFKGQALQPSVAVRADGLTAIAYYFTDAKGPVNSVPSNASWTPRVAILDPTGTWITTATLSETAVLRGPLCDHGVDCPASASPLREFLSVAWRPDGTLTVAYTDAAESSTQNSDVGSIMVGRIDVR